ncbi:MAG: phage major capsid protein [Xanthomonadales bacterium]|nr:phage major capsid protein [Xanthomonadales bacterium]
MDNAQIKEQIDGLRSDWAEHLRANTERIRQEAKGVVDPLLREQLDRINEALDKRQEAMNTILATVQTDVKKVALAGAKDDGLTSDQREYKRAFGAYMRRGRDEGLGELQMKAMSVGSDPDGGYLVSPDTTGRIVNRMAQLTPIRQFCSQQTITVDALEGLKDQEDAGFSWVSEQATRSTTTTPQLGKWEIRLHEGYCQPAATQKLLDMASFDPEAWLASKVARAGAKGSGTAFTTGDGAGKPRGFASYTTAATADASRSWGVFEHVATGANGSFGTDPVGLQKLMLLMSKLDESHVANAAFYMNRTTKWAARGLTDASSAGKFVFVPSFVAGVPDSLLGAPVRTLPDMATYTTTDALAVAYGDMEEAYQIVDGVGPRVLRDPFSSKPFVLFYTTFFFGGDVVNFNALKFLKFGS